MRSEHALRYLLLKHLWKLRSLTDPDLHAEVAKSLNVEQIAGLYIITWTRRSESNRIECPADLFGFYKRGDIPTEQEGSAPRAAHDNEEAAHRMAAGILAVSSQPSESGRPVGLYYDVWRWPLLCTLAAAASLVPSRSLLLFVLAGTTVLETRVRTYRLYVGLAAALILGGYRSSAVLVGIMLAGITCLGSTTGRGRAEALVYLVLAYIGWRSGPYSNAAVPSLSYILPFALISICVWTVLWLSFEGPRLSILITPVMSVSLLFDGRFDLALACLLVCLIYSAWLVVPVRFSESRRLQ
jgi:hypothetical protein